MQKETLAFAQQPIVKSSVKSEKEVTNAQLMAKLIEMEKKLIRVEEKLCKPLIN